MLGITTKKNYPNHYLINKSTPCVTRSVTRSMIICGDITSANYYKTNTSDNVDKKPYDDATTEYNYKTDKSDDIDTPSRVLFGREVIEEYLRKCLALEKTKI